MLDRLKLDCKKESNVLINTFIDSSYRKLSEVNLNFKLEGNSPVSLPFLVDADFNLSFTVDGLKDAHSNVAKQYNLMDQFHDNTVVLEGLIGVDAIQYLENVSLVNCLGGIALKFDNKYVPLGNVDNFLFNKQLNLKYSSTIDNAPCEELNVDTSIVNNVLNPVKTGFDPVGPWQWILWWKISWIKCLMWNLWG